MKYLKTPIKQTVHHFHYSKISELKWPAGGPLKVSEYIRTLGNGFLKVDGILKISPMVK